MSVQQYYNCVCRNNMHFFLLSRQCTMYVPPNLINSQVGFITYITVPAFHALGNTIDAVLRDKRASLIIYSLFLAGYYLQLVGSFPNFNFELRGWGKFFETRPNVNCKSVPITTWIAAHSKITGYTNTGTLIYRNFSPADSAIPRYRGIEDNYHIIMWRF